MGMGDFSPDSALRAYFLISESQKFGFPGQFLLNFLKFIKIFKLKNRCLCCNLDFKSFKTFKN